MVQIPRLSQQQVAPQALPAVSTDPGAYGSGLRGGGGGGGGLQAAFHPADMERVHAERQKALHAMNLDAVDSLSEYGDHLWAGEEIELPGLAGPGLSRRSGEDYLAAVGAAEDAFAERATLLMEKLPTEAREMAARQFRQQAQAFGATLLRRETEQRNVLYQGRYERGQDQIERSAVARASVGVVLNGEQLDSSMIDHMLQDQEDRIRVHASEHPELLGGLTEQEWVAAELRTRRTDLHAAVIDALLAGERDQEAVAYVERYGDELDPEVATKKRAQVSAASVLGDSLRITATLQAAMPVEVGATAKLRPAALLVERLKIVDQEAKKNGWDEVRRAAARQTVREETARERQEAEALHQERFQAVDEALLATGGDLRTVQRNFADEWQDALPHERLAWEARAKEFRDGADNADRVADDAALSRLSYENPEAFRGVDLAAHQAVLGTALFEKWAKVQDAMKKGDTELVSLSGGVAKAIGDYLKLRHTEGTAEYLDEFQRVSAEIAEEQKLAKRQLGEAEVRKLLGKLTSEQVIERAWAFDTTIEPILDIPELPLGMALAAREELEAAGVAPTRANILALEKSRAAGVAAQQLQPNQPDSSSAATSPPQDPAPSQPVVSPELSAFNQIDWEQLPPPPLYRAVWNRLDMLPPILRAQAEAERDGYLADLDAAREDWQRQKDEQERLAAAEGRDTYFETLAAQDALDAELERRRTAAARAEAARRAHQPSAALVPGVHGEPTSGGQP